MLNIKKLSIVVDDLLSQCRCIYYIYIYYMYIPMFQHWLEVLVYDSLISCSIVTLLSPHIMYIYIICSLYRYICYCRIGKHGKKVGSFRLLSSGIPIPVGGLVFHRHRWSVERFNGDVSGVGCCQSMAISKYAWKFKMKSTRCTLDTHMHDYARCMNIGFAASCSAI